MYDFVYSSDMALTAINYDVPSNYSFAEPKVMLNYITDQLNSIEM
jgi:hypothetical protein